MTPRPPYSNEHNGLTTLIRLYALAGDLKGADQRLRQNKIYSALKTARWELAKDIGRYLGLFPQLEWYELVGEYIKAVKSLVDAGDNDLRDTYKKGLNTLIANKDKRVQFITERLKAIPDEVETLKKLLMEDIIHTSGYIRCRDKNENDDELWHWEQVRATNSQIGTMIDALIQKRGDENGKSESADGRPCGQFDGNDRRRTKPAVVDNHRGNDLDK